MKLKLLNPEDFAKAIHEHAHGHAFVALDSTTTQSMKTVLVRFSAQASNEHGPYLIVYERSVGFYLSAVDKTEFQSARSRAQELEKALTDLGLTLSPGMWVD